MHNNSSQRTAHVFVTFFFLPSLHNYDVKVSNFTFYGGRKQGTTKFSFTFSLRNSTPGEFAYIWQKSELEQSQWRLPFCCRHHPRIIRSLILGCDHTRCAWRRTLARSVPPQSYRSHFSRISYK